jgi:type I restriction enzyme S subunit
MKRWPTKPLGELAGGGQYGLNAAAMSEGTGVRFIRITDITQDGELRHAEPAFVPKDTPELDGYELKNGDVLIARSGATAGKSYIHRSFGERAVFAGYLIRFQPDTAKVLPRFIGAFLQTPAYWQQLNSHKRAVAQPNVNAKQLASLVLPVPQLAEQERIVKLLDEADELRKLRAQADHRTAALIPALFHEMFGDPLGGKHKWPEIRFEEVTRRITYGFTSPMKHLESGIPIVTCKNVLNGEIDFQNVHYADSDEFAALTAKSKPQRNDILITKDGTIGRCAVVDVDYPICINQSVALIQLKLDKVTPVFLSHYILFPSVNAFLNGMGKGQALKHLQITELAKMPIPSPPLALQKEFAARVTEIRAVQAEQAASRQRLENLFQSLLHRAFQGEL